MGKERIELFCAETERERESWADKNSMSHHDCQPYYLQTGESWTKIDYKKKAEEWMKPLVKGTDTGLVEIPAVRHFGLNMIYGWARH